MSLQKIGQACRFSSSVKWAFIILCSVVATGFAEFNDIVLKKETKLFDIVHNGEKIGVLKAEKHLRRNRITYISSTRIETTILLIKKINIRYKYKVSYQSGVLHKSNVNIKINNKKPQRIIVDRSGNRYRIHASNQENLTIERAIQHSSILLYFEEPKNITKSFSERSGRFNTMEQIEEGLYRMVNEKGNENIYHYTDGALTLMEVDSGIVRFEIITR